MAYSDYHYNTNTQRIWDALKSVVEESQSLFVLFREIFISAVWCYSRRSTTCLAFVFTTLALLTSGKSRLLHFRIVWLSTTENNNDSNNKENREGHIPQMKKLKLQPNCIPCCCRMAAFTSLYLVWGSLSVWAGFLCLLTSSVYINLYTLFP